MTSDGDKVAPGFHAMSILPIGPGEFNVTCDNKRCNFNVTKATRNAAKDAAWSHLIELIRSET